MVNSSISKENLITYLSHESKWGKSHLPISVMELLNGELDTQMVTYFTSGLKFEDVNLVNHGFLNSPPPCNETSFWDLKKVEETIKIREMPRNGHYFVFGATRQATQLTDKEVYTLENPATLVGINTFVENSVNNQLIRWKKDNSLLSLKKLDIICEQFNIPCKRGFLGVITIIVIWVGNLKLVDTLDHQQTRPIKIGQIDKQNEQVTIKIAKPDEFIVEGMSDEVARLLPILSSQPLNMKQLLQTFNYKDSQRKTFSNKFIKPAKDGGWVETTEPMQSNKQKYRLTESGKLTLQQLNQVQK